MTPFYLQVGKFACICCNIAKKEITVNAIPINNAPNGVNFFIFYFLVIFV